MAEAFEEAERTEWMPIETAPFGVLVETKIDDEMGPRNEARLWQCRPDERSRPLWWPKDGSMYVYYTPTHWRPLQEPSE